MPWSTRPLIPPTDRLTPCSGKARGGVSLGISGVSRAARISGKSRETKLVTVLRWRDTAPACPGQFVMVWVPGVDEIPMSLCHIGPVKGIAVHEKGEATRALAALRPGTLIGVRGPMGKGFVPMPGKALVVAGGTGIAALSPLVEGLSRSRGRPTVVIGARTAGELLFVARARRAGAEVVITTEDGSEGIEGLATDAARELLSGGSYSRIYTCGPEPMMRIVAELGAQEGIPVQLSLERYMKCGIGICDSCSLGGFHVCIEGPVVDGALALSLPDFGRFRRDACGRREKM